MNARTSWSASADRQSGENPREPGESPMPLDDLLDARFDEEGRLAQLGRGNRERIAERLDPRPPAMSAEELERAVQKLALGLEAIERQGSAALDPRATDTRRGRGRGRAAERAETGDEFVTYNLDRLEARLEALSRRLQPRAEPAAADSPAAAALPAGPAEPDVERVIAADPWQDTSAAVDADADADVEVRYRAEAARTRREAEEKRRPDAEARDAASVVDTRQALQAQPQAPADGWRQFAALEGRIQAIQQSCDENQIEPVRQELMQLLRHVEELARDGRSIAGAVEQVSAKLDDMETAIASARDVAGSRLGELRDRLSGVTERLVGMEAEVPGFDALRENQTAILERFDRMEELVQRAASPNSLLEQVGTLRQQLQAVPSARDTARIEEKLLALTDRFDAASEEANGAAALERLEAQLHALAVDFAEAKGQREARAADLERRLAELFTSVQALGGAERAPDVSGLEGKLSEIAARLDADRRASGGVLERLDTRIADLATAMETRENAASAEFLAGLTSRMDALAFAIAAQDERDAQREPEALEHRLDQLARLLTEQGERLSRPQLQPLEERLDRLQGQLEDYGARAAEASSASFGPFAQTLQDISERVSGLGSAASDGAVAERLAAIEARLANFKAPEARALHTQLESIVSKLELLKGRSIDPARMTEVFDRVDAVVRNLGADERFDRLEQKLDQAGLSAERIARFEQASEAGPAAGMSDERFARLEQKLAELGRADRSDGADGSVREEIGELRADIVALRRELRSLPGLGQGEGNLAAVLQTISAQLQGSPQVSGELERQIGRIAEVIEDPSHSRMALAHIEASLKAMEERLGEVRHVMMHRGPDTADGGESDIGAVAGLARALSDDVTALKSTTERSDRKTKDALEAVQGTLEAVVKRMAFLERDANRHDEPHAVPRHPIESPEVTQAHAVQPESSSAGVAPVVPTQPAELAAETPSGGLFSRFTSSQLLKRATGGRTDSFSPDSDDGEDGADVPLEPGTDTPLSSALAGAPSSDTAHMSGDRSRMKAARLAGRGSEEGVTPGSLADPFLGDDFLAAARRAAQAAAREAAEADDLEPEVRGLARILRSKRTRRSLVLASLLAIAVAVAAVQLVRSRQASRPIPPQPVATAPAERLTASPKPAAAAKPAPRVVAAAAVDGARFTPEAPSRRAATAAAAPAARATAASDVPAPRAVAARDVATSAPAPLRVSAAMQRDIPPALPPAASTPLPSRQASASAPANARPELSTMAIAAVAPTEAPPAATASGPTTTPALPLAGGALLPAPIGPEKLRLAASSGDAAAAFEVASRYAEGRGGAQDLSASVAWYARAADADLAPAQYRLGSIYEKGIGVPKDLVAAQKWYTRAAEAGNVKAMHNLAVLHAEGAGGAPDLEGAARLFREAAEHGVRDSQFNLAILHARGLGVRQDMLEAFKWFAVAASSGDAESLKRRDIVGATLSKPNLVKAQAAAVAFEPQPLDAEANEVMVPDGGWGADATSVEAATENDLVAMVQVLLTEKGYDPGPPDGLLGLQTIQAITAFQQEAGLPPTGQIDDRLVAALKDSPT